MRNNATFITASSDSHGGRYYTTRIVREKLSWKLAAVGGVFVLLLGLAFAAILYRSPEITQDQTVFPLGLAVSPNPFPAIGLDTDGVVNFTFELTVINPDSNPNLTLTVFVQPSLAVNVSVFHCLENSQPNLTSLNVECSDPELQGGHGEYVANVTSGDSFVFEIFALFIGTVNEPTTITWVFFAEGEEIP